MENIKTLYYERFIQHVVEAYSQKLKSAKPGHCMKITGLAMKELRVLLPLLRPLNSGMEVYILSETEKGDEYIHATKLIELRNNPDKSVLILVPSNSRTSAEWRKRSIPTHSGWLYPLTFDAGKYVFFISD